MIIVTHKSIVSIKTHIGCEYLQAGEELVVFGRPIRSQMDCFNGLQRVKIEDLSVPANCHTHFSSL